MGDLHHLINLAHGDTLLAEVQLEVDADVCRKVDADWRNLAEDNMEDSDACPAFCTFEQATLEHGDGKWQRRLSYTDRVRIHLARSLIMNPEVMVLQRPLMHFEPPEQQCVLNVLRKHVQNRGIGMAENALSSRRPRTVFTSAETKDQASRADIVWKMKGLDAPCSVVPEGVFMQQ